MKFRTNGIGRILSTDNPKAIEKLKKLGLEVVEDESPAEKDDLKKLKERADALGVKYHPAIGYDKLEAKVIEAEQK
jgi:hypothetical protein